jgi:N-acetylglutamate synthase-like GNAT family acetyltransferase
MKPASTESSSRIEVRRSESGDSAEVVNLLLLNGVPERLAREEAFLVAAGEGGLLAALAYRVEARCLTLGVLVADPWAGERFLAKLLYAEAHALARELGLREVRAATGVHGDYPHEVGYLKRSGGWRLETDRPLRLRDELPEGGWRRILALWGMTPGVPFFGAFDRRQGGLP